MKTDGPCHLIFGVIILQIKFSNRGSTLIVSLVGELDQHSAEYTRQKIDAEIIRSTTKNIVFDLSKMSFMDSSGIGVIMGRYKNISRLKGKIAIAAAMPQIKRILDISGIFKFIPYFQSASEAVAKVVD